ncbi:MAG TPA: hypothetical protein VMH27_08900 [Puia sp.]|nr:hypothetical protein [Puia sp.]
MNKIILLLVFLLVAGMLRAQSRSPADDNGQIHVGHFLFAVPPGWKTAGQGGIFSMSAPDLGPEEGLTFLLLPPLTDGSFLSSADATLSLLATSMQGQAIPQNYSTHALYFELHSGRCGKGWDYSFGTGVIHVPYKDPNLTYSSTINFTIGVFLAKVNGRIERVAYISKDYKCGIYGTTTAYKWTYGPVIDDFFFDLRFDDWTEPPTRRGKITNTGVSGVWSGVAYIPGSFVTNQPGKYDATVIILFDNGQVYYGGEWPRRGLANINTFSEAANHPDHWGTYTWQDGSGVMKISSWQTIPFTIRDGKLISTISGSQRPFERMAPMEDIRLEGAWCEYNGGACIRLSADGRFEDNGVICRAEHTPTTCNEALPQQGQGTYEIRDHSIVFSYSTGVTTRIAMSGLGLQKGNNSPDKLFLGWQNDVLEKK